MHAECFGLFGPLLQEALPAIRLEVIAIRLKAIALRLVFFRTKQVTSVEFGTVGTHHSPLRFTRA